MKGKGDMDVNGMEVFRCRRGHVAVSNDGFTGKKCCVLATVKQCGAKLELWLKMPVILPTPVSYAGLVAE